MMEPGLDAVPLTEEGTLYAERVRRTLTLAALLTPQSCESDRRIS